MGREIDMSTGGGSHGTHEVRHAAPLFPCAPVTCSLLAIGFVIVAADVLFNVLPGFLENGTSAENVSILQLSEELTLPAWFTSSLAIACSIAFFAVYRRAREAALPRHAFWLVLSLAFAFLSLDEALMIHERLGERLGRILPDDFMPYARWTIIYTPAVALFAAAAIPFLKRQPPHLRRRLVGCGAIYVGGALGLELVERAVVTAGRQASMLFDTLVILEESLEIAGLILLLGTLLAALETDFARVPLRARPVGSPVTRGLVTLEPEVGEGAAPAAAPRRARRAADR